MKLFFQDGSGMNISCIVVRPTVPSRHLDKTSGPSKCQLGTSIWTGQKLHSASKNCTTQVHDAIYTSNIPFNGQGKHETGSCLMVHNSNGFGVCIAMCFTPPATNSLSHDLQGCLWVKMHDYLIGALYSLFCGDKRKLWRI